MNSEKTTLLSLRNIEWRTVKTETNKINQVLPSISTNDINELNELIYAGAKLVCEKIGIPRKSTKKKNQSQGWEIQLETQIKKNLRKQAKMIKQRKDAGICWNQKEKGNTKYNNTTWGNKPERAGERRKIKEISTKGKTIQIMQDIPKQQTKIISMNGRGWYENIPTPGCKRNRSILDWNMATKKQRKGRMDKQYDKKIRSARRRP